MLNPRDPSRFATDSKIAKVQFSRLPSQDVLFALDDYLRTHSDTAVRFFSNSGDWVSLGFLRQIPHVRKLILDNTDARHPITSLEPISALKSLQDLTITSIAKRKIDFSPLSTHSKSLQHLSVHVDRKTHTGFYDLLPHLQNLSSLGFPSGDFGVIAGLSKLEFLNLGAGTFLNEHVVTSLPKLRRVRFMRSKLSQIEAYFSSASLETVEFLHMPDLGIRSLPDHSPALSFLYLDGFASLETLSVCATYHKLDTLVVRRCHLAPSCFAFLLDCESLRRVFVEYKTKGDREAFAAIAPAECVLTAPVAPS